MQMRNLIRSGPPGMLGGLIKPRNAKRKRASSHDPTGGNNDRVAVGPGKKHVLLHHKGAGCITHLWITLSGPPKMYRECVLRMYWDDEAEPSVEVPVGDFFGIGHCIVRNWWSLPLSAGPQDGKGFNCWFPMPFKKSARIEFANESKKTFVSSLYYYVDYEAYNSPPDDDWLYFHAQWRLENPCDGLIPSHHPMMEHMLLKNVDGKDNYTFIEAEGKGHVVGVILNVHNLRSQMEGNWWGEGDDAWWIDDDFENLHPETGNPVPSIWGTGSEDFF
ncbi:MAG: glycoside hydrolase family 172 protein, partial [Promethearchaeota archaeon]